MTSHWIGPVEGWNGNIPGKPLRVWPGCRIPEKPNGLVRVLGNGANGNGLRGVTTDGVSPGCFGAGAGVEPATGLVPVADCVANERYVPNLPFRERYTSNDKNMIVIGPTHYPHGESLR
jgi:hypothetical protein